MNGVFSQLLVIGLAATVCVGLLGSLMDVAPRLRRSAVAQMAAPRPGWGWSLLGATMVLATVAYFGPPLAGDILGLTNGTHAVVLPQTAKSPAPQPAKIDPFLTVPTASATPKNSSSTARFDLQELAVKLNIEQLKANEVGVLLQDLKSLQARLLQAAPPSGSEDANSGRRLRPVTLLSHSDGRVVTTTSQIIARVLPACTKPLSDEYRPTAVPSAECLRVLNDERPQLAAQLRLLSQDQDWWKKR